MEATGNGLETKLGVALRLLRSRQKLTQAAASRRDGAPNFASLSHWENGRKVPSLKLLYTYLQSLGLDLSDLQEALDRVAGVPPIGRREAIARLERRIEELERRVGLDGSQEVEETTSKRAPQRAFFDLP